MFLLRNQLIPLLDLSGLLNIDNNHERGFYIAILEAKGRRFGLTVDDMEEPQEIVVKPLSSALSSLNVYSGATILGDGTIALILDTTGLARSAKLCDTGERAVVSKECTVDSHVPQGKDRIPLLLFVDHRDEQAVVPLAYVERIEQLDRDVIETLAGEDVLPYRDELVPLEDRGGLLKSNDSRSAPRFLLICNRPGGVRAGLVVRDVLNAVDGEVLPATPSRGGRVARVGGRLAMFFPGFEPKGDVLVEANDALHEDKQSVELFEEAA